MSTELAVSYAALILADDGETVTADKLTTLLNKSGNEVDAIWPTLFAKALQGKDIKDLVSNIGSGGGGGGAAPAAAATSGGAAAADEKPAAKEEEKEESDEDMGFGLFD